VPAYSKIMAISREPQFAHLHAKAL
jgi:hypothetical protein